MKLGRVRVAYGSGYILPVLVSIGVKSRATTCVIANEQMHAAPIALQ